MNCKQCGIQLVKQPSKKGRPTVFCSIACKENSKPKKKPRTPKSRICETCGNQFEANFAKQRYCSHICALKRTRLEKELPVWKCVMCGNMFRSKLPKKTCGIHCKLAFHRSPDSRINNSEKQRKPIPCLPCLRKVGFGAKSIARILRQPLTTVKQACRRLKIHVPKRHSIAFGLQKRPVGCGLPKRTKDERNASKALNALKAAFDEDHGQWMFRKKTVEFGSDCEHWISHPVATTELRRLRYKRYKQEATNYHISKLIRTRVRSVLRKQSKSGQTLELLGCTWQQLREHLQLQFKRGMSWSNQGKWHIDHIIPCASFDLSDPAQQRKCFHYSNMRPMWAEENIRKGARIQECQPELTLAIHTGRDYFLQPRHALASLHPVRPAATNADAPRANVGHTAGTIGTYPTPPIKTIS